MDTRVQELKQRIASLEADLLRTQVMLASLKGQPVVSQVREWLELQAAKLAESDQHPIPSQPMCAKVFGMSGRTLHRHLVGAGLSFSTLWVECWLKLAREMLLKGEPIAKIAGRCGFSTGPAFHRAVRRETGMSAREWRIALKGA
jgi:AraC-like DNA-binding protein